MRRSTIFDRDALAPDVASGPHLAFGQGEVEKPMPLRDRQAVPVFSAMRYIRGKGRPEAMQSRSAKFGIGQVVKHRFYPFRGVIFDVDPVFANTEEWWRSIPAEVRPAKEQPFYHLYAENEDSQYVAYVSEQNLVSDESGEPVRHPQVTEAFERTDDGRYCARDRSRLA
jgi:heat shock protein HspQ